MTVPFCGPGGRFLLLSLCYPGSCAKYPKLDLNLHVCRIYRDARRLHGQGPYKDHLWLTIRPENDIWSQQPVFWFEITPEEWSYGVGFWNAGAQTLARGYPLRSAPGSRWRTESGFMAFHKTGPISDPPAQPCVPWGDSPPSSSPGRSPRWPPPWGPSPTPGRGPAPPTMLFDTHAHYDAEEFSQDREAVLDGLPARDISLGSSARAIWSRKTRRWCSLGGFSSQ